MDTTGTERRPVTIHTGRSGGRDILTPAIARRRPGTGGRHRNQGRYGCDAPPATSSERADGLQTPASELLPLGAVPGHLIRVAQQVHERIWVRRVGPDLTSVQYGVLLVLGSRPGLDQRQIGDAMSLDKSNVADVVRRLGQRELLARDSDPEDAGASWSGSPGGGGR